VLNARETEHGVHVRSWACENAARGRKEWWVGEAAIGGGLARRESRREAHVRGVEDLGSGRICELLDCGSDVARWALEFHFLML
jgi:hypothetical protein